MNRNVTFIHGLGQSPDVWKPIIEQIPNIEASTPNLFGALASTDELTLASLTDSVAATMREPAHVVGLSVGGLVALDLGLRYPDLALSIYSSAPAVNPPQALLKIQKMLMKILPASASVPDGLSKRQLLSLVDSLGPAELRPKLPGLTIPTTIACGSKDKPNMASSREAAREIPGAHFDVVDGVGHPWNEQNPDLFARSVVAHLERTGAA